MNKLVYEIFKDLYKIDGSTFLTGGTIPNFPPFNVKKTGENTYLIEFAVAGYSKQDIEVEYHNGILKIKSETKPDETPANGYLWKGIAQRAFEQSFKLAETVQITNANLTNGILKIFLENIVPESKKPKKINIDDDDNTHPPAKKEYLAEKL